MRVNEGEIGNDLMCLKVSLAVENVQSSVVLVAISVQMPIVSGRS